MATTNYGRTYYPEGSLPPNVPEEMGKLAASIEGRTVMEFASIAAKDAAFSTLTDDQKKGVIFHVAGVGWQGYDNGTWRQFVTGTQIKCGHYMGTSETNNMFRIPAAQCFFGGAAPDAVLCMWTGVDVNYYCSFGQFDGAGALIRVTSNVSGQQILYPGTATFFWIAAKNL